MKLDWIWTLGLLSSNLSTADRIAAGLSPENDVQAAQPRASQENEDVKTSISA